VCDGDWGGERRGDPGMERPDKVSVSVRGSVGFKETVPEETVVASAELKERVGSASRGWTLVLGRRTLATVMDSLLRTDVSHC